MDDYKPITQEELNRGYFFITHRLLIKKIIFGIAIFSLAIFYGVIIFKFIDYINSPSFNDTALEIKTSTFNWANYHSQRTPKELKLAKTQFNSLGDRRYNITALVENLNEDWVIKSVDYHFVSQGKDTPTRTTFMNPGEKKLFALTAYQSDVAIRNPKLVVSNIEWYRIDNSFPNINIEISNIKFQAASRNTVDGVTTELPARVIWQAYNSSLYNFWEVGWQVVLYNGDTVVAINELKTKDFLALENRDLETVWLNKLARVTRVSVFPILNKLDTGIFKDIYIAPTTDNR